MNNIRAKALKELSEQFPDGTFSHFVLIFKKPDMSYRWIFTTRYMLKEIDQLVQREYPGSSIEEIGYIWPTPQNAPQSPKTGYINEWRQYRDRRNWDSRKDSIFKLVIDQYQPI